MAFFDQEGILWNQNQVHNHHQHQVNATNKDYSGIIINLLQLTVLNVRDPSVVSEIDKLLNSTTSERRKNL